MARKKVHPVIAEWYAEITSKGGKARAESLTPAQRKRIARKAGRALQATRTPEERKASARKASLARWKAWREREARKKQGR
jgi:hypothetical protein